MRLSSCVLFAAMLFSATFLMGQEARLQLEDFDCSKYPQVSFSFTLDTKDIPGRHYQDSDFELSDCGERVGDFSVTRAQAVEDSRDTILQNLKGLAENGSLSVPGSSSLGTPGGGLLEGLIKVRNQRAVQMKKYHVTYLATRETLTGETRTMVFTENQTGNGIARRYHVEKSPDNNQTFFVRPEFKIPEMKFEIPQMPVPDLDFRPPELPFPVESSEDKYQIKVPTVPVIRVPAIRK